MVSLRGGGPSARKDGRSSKIKKKKEDLRNSKKSIVRKRPYLRKARLPGGRRTGRAELPGAKKGENPYS